MDPKAALMQTKAGRRFAGFMKVFNAGNADQVRDYVAQYTTDEALAANSVDEWMRHLGGIYQATGAMRVFQVVAADEYRVVTLMQAQNGGLYLTEMAVEEDYPHKVAEFIHKPAG